MKYTISIHPEDLKGRTVYVGIVEENNVSSFGFTPEEALDMTLEALQLKLEVDAEIEQERKIRELLASLIRVSDNQYSLSLPQYADNIQVRGSHKNRKETLMAT